MRNREFHSIQHSRIKREDYHLKLKGFTTETIPNHFNACNIVNGIASWLQFSNSLLPAFSKKTEQEKVGTYFTAVSSALPRN